MSDPEEAVTAGPAPPIEPEEPEEEESEKQDLLLKREGNYNNYGKPGHWAREYRLPKKEVRTIEKEKKLTKKQLRKKKKVSYIAKRTGTLSRILVIVSRGEDIRRFREENIESSNSEEEESSEEEENSVL